MEYVEYRFDFREVTGVAMVTVSTSRVIGSTMGKISLLKHIIGTMHFRP